LNWVLSCALSRILRLRLSHGWERDEHRQEQK
jgi:hypothetical protein